MGTVRLDKPSDYVRHKANVVAFCSCSHRGVVDGQKLQRWFFCHGWNDSMVNVQGRLRCSICWGRPVKLKASLEKPNGPEWGPRYEHDWAQLVKRIRNR